MKAFLSAGLAAVLLTAAAPAGSAHPRYHYTGGCGFTTISDGTDSAGTRWSGEARAVVVATFDDPQTPARTVPITVECELYVDFVHVATPLAASGTGFAADYAVPFEYVADPDSIVHLCDLVTVGGETHRDCGISSGPPWSPFPPWVAEFLDAALDVAETVTNDLVCAEFAAQDGGPADQPPLDIRPGGDVYVGGEWFWDCEPYGV